MSLVYWLRTTSGSERTWNRVGNPTNLDRINAPQITTCTETLGPPREVGNASEKP